MSEIRTDRTLRFEWLEGDLDGRTRSLWEECFPEDSVSFLEYYYSVKTKDNELAVLWDSSRRPAVMIHLNPYTLMIGGGKFRGHYMVAVATSKSYRRRGLMTKLAREAMSVMKERGEIVTFLEPASEAYYTSLGFRRISGVSEWRMGPEEQEEARNILTAGDLETTAVMKSETLSTKKVRELAAEVNAYLRDNYELYARRDLEYYETLRAELLSEGGDFYILEKDERIVGCFGYWISEEELEVREPIAAPGFERELLKAILDKTVVFNRNLRITGFEPLSEEGLPDTGERSRKPKMMFRTLDLEHFLDSVSMPSFEGQILRVRDEAFPENNGMYRFSREEEGVFAARYTGVKPPDITMSIEDFTELIGTKARIYMTEVV